MTVAEPVDNINVHGISPESCDRRHRCTGSPCVQVSMRYPDPPPPPPPQQPKQLGVYFDGSLVFYAMTIADFGESILLFAAFSEWVEHDQGLYVF